MKDAPHYVIIGNGAAGNEAAWHLRQRDPDSRITIITAGTLLFLNRYQLPRVFEGLDDWRTLLVHAPEYYVDLRITVRRNTRVVRVDPERRQIALAHKETIRYDKLLIASGGGGYLPADLRQYRPLLHSFSTFRGSTLMRRALPEQGGQIILLGGDMKGLDLARVLVRIGHQVVVAGNDQLFWPHEIAAEKRPRFIVALERMGLRVIADCQVAGIEAGAGGEPARRVNLEDGRVLRGDVVTAAYGLMPNLEFMAGTSVDIERGLLVSPDLRTVDDFIWAAGDVCQIWSPEENQYRFYHGWKNVKMMGRIAAINMTGGEETIDTFQENQLRINGQGALHSPFWEHD
jgi:NAD(P)H-nitrite reductase large subunit